jgi:hypothetical protein
MNAIPHDGRLGPEVTGSSVVSAETLRKKLGFAAYLVWQILCQRRDEHGLTHVSVIGRNGSGGICRARGFNSLSAAQVKRALVRLRVAGLVKDLHRRRQWLRGEFWAFQRKVSGCTAIAPGQSDVVLVPPQTWKWLRDAPGRGGVRAGAGRPGKRPAEDVWCGLNSPNDCTCEQENGTETTQKLEFKPHPTEIIQSRTIRAPNVNDPEGVRMVRFDFDEIIKPHPRSSTVCEVDYVPSERSQSPSATPSGLLLCIGVDTPDPDGLHFGGTAPASLPLLLDGQDGIPPRPTATNVPLPTIPAPPKLPEGLSDFEAARWLMNAYRGAVNARYYARTMTGKKPKRCMVLIQRGALEKSPYLPVLVTAARTMRDCDIAPAAWVAWNVDLWKGRGDKASAKPPPLRYVFSEKRILEKRGWFGKEAGSYEGRRSIPVPTAQALKQRWSTMWRQLCAQTDRSQEAVSATVARWFPEGLYERMVQEARAETIDMQARLNSDALSGRWIGW